MEPKQEYINWAKGFSGCDGGDIGSRDRKSIWVCGIESGAQTPENINFQTQLEPPKGWGQQDALANGLKSPLEMNTRFHYFRQTMKILTALKGNSVNKFEYTRFAMDEKPFVEGSSGYFKLNLFPINFQNTEASNWTDSLTVSTGLPNKQEYEAWLRKHRFRSFRSWLEKYQPKLVICTGVSYKKDFFDAFRLEDDKQIVVEEKIVTGRSIFIRKIYKTNTLVVVVPFMSGRNGLVKNSQIEAVGKEINYLMKEFQQL